jgi:hypothetical protein
MAIFVWTPEDVIGLLLLAIVGGGIGVIKVLEWWDSRKQRRRKSNRRS